jgi:hypothetical protein
MMSPGKRSVKEQRCIVPTNRAHVADDDDEDDNGDVQLSLAMSRAAAEACGKSWSMAPSRRA